MRTKMKVEIAVRVSAIKKWNKHKSHITAKSLGNIVKTIMKTVGLQSAFKSIACSILLSDDAEIRSYNAKYRQIDTPTNVLSFPYESNLKSNWERYRGQRLQLGILLYLLIAFERK